MLLSCFKNYPQASRWNHLRGKSYKQTLNTVWNGFRISTSTFILGLRTWVFVVTCGKVLWELYSIVVIGQNAYCSVELCKKSGLYSVQSKIVFLVDSEPRVNFIFSTKIAKDLTTLLLHLSNCFSITVHNFMFSGFHPPLLMQLVSSPSMEMEEGSG